MTGAPASTDPSVRRRQRLLRLLPPPHRLALPLRILPKVPLQRALERLVSVALAEPLAAGDLAFLEGRRLGIEVVDLGLHWVVSVHAGRLTVLEHGSADESRVSGSLTDLLMLASRIEDADTLFFQRRLRLTGDTELGLTARNLLDGLSWESLPLRIGLVRLARLAASARAAHRSEY